MPRLFLAAAAALPTQILLLPAFVAAGALYLFASCVRAIGRLLEPRFVPWADLMAFDGKLGWKPRPNLDAHYLAERDDVYRVVTDAEGWPGRQSLDDSVMVVIGDSFAFGYGVDAGSSFADVKPGITIKSVGAPGYSMVHSVLLMEQFAHRLAGKLVVWFVCLENDLEDNLSPGMWRYRTPFVRPSHVHGEWEIANEHLTEIPWRAADLGRKRLFPHLCVPGPIADRVFAGCDFLVGRAAACCTAVGARLVLVTIPDPVQLTDSGRSRLASLSGRPESCDANLPDRRLAASCERFGVPIVAGKEHLSIADYKRREAIHWNERGHRRMAEVLTQLYESFRTGALDRIPSSQAVARNRMTTLHESHAGSR